MDYIWTSLSAVQKAVKHNHSLSNGMHMGHIDLYLHISKEQN